MKYSEPSAKPATANGQNSAQDNLDGLTVRFQNLVQRKKAQLRAVKPVTVTPNWPAPMRGTPNACLRSALFAGIQGNAYKKRTLAY